MVSLVNIINNIDKSDAPIGHGLKAIKDMAELLDGKIEVLASEEYIREFPERVKKLPYSIYSGDRKNVEWKMFINYFASIFCTRNKTLLYVISLEPLLWGIALTKQRKRIILLTYYDWDLYVRNKLSDKPFRRYLVRKGLGKVDGFITSNMLYHPKKPYIRIPDYFMSEEMKEYAKNPKKRGCVCLGEVRYGKDILGLVRVMKKTDLPLLIAGSFQCDETYQKVRSIEAENIKIINRNLDYKEYLERLSAFRYVVLPYDMECYGDKTSGVLLEGIFVGAIPIAPIALLKQNHVQGLGYRKISQIPDLIKEYEEGNIEVYNDLSRYDRETVKRKVKKFLRERD